MSKPRKSQDLPRTISGLGVILAEKQGKPASIQPVLDAIDTCLKTDPANNRLKAFDKKIQQIAKTNPSSLTDFGDWLKLPQTQEILRKAGAPNLAEIWINGLKKIQKGSPATAVFGSRGKPHTWTFSESQVKALKTEDLHRKGMKLQDAITSVYGPDVIDDREIRRTRSKLEVKHAATDILPLLSQPRRTERK